MTLAGTYRLPVFHLESHQRHLCKWTTLAENRWTHHGRKLTPLILNVASNWMPAAEKTIFQKRD
jgi:hypothetical protein